MGPATAYRAALASGDIEPDPAQAAAVAAFDRLYHELRDWRPAAAAPLARRLLPQLRSGFRSRSSTPTVATPPVRGLYLWGGVGRGKTWLMDQFFDTLPFAAKRRLHFHRFMQQVHVELGRLQGRQDPLTAVAAGLAGQARVLCLDEMQVNDITDAMLMAGLLDALFAHGVTLVTTANIPPDGLYRAGLQRDRFLPAIGLIQRHCEVLELESPTDYRLRQLTRLPVYLTPLGQTADTRLARWFNDLVGPHPGLAGAPGPAPVTEPDSEPSPDLAPDQTLDWTRGPSQAGASSAIQTGAVGINGRAIPVVAAGNGIVWFDFDVICHIPRSKLDYVEVARGYQTVLLSNVRCLNDEQANIAHRLITLIDALYDRNCRLILSAEALPADLYRGRDLAFEFQRTASRLTEMQSADYLGRAHLG